MLKLPFFAALEKSQNVLLAGAGGGYDVFSGLPLYFALRDSGRTVHLANLAFTRLPGRGLREVVSGCYEVGPLLRVSKIGPEALVGDYFPELYLSTWLSLHLGKRTPIYGLDRMAAAPMLEAYRWLVKEHAIDTVILVDGGTDSLMRGDETGLGTPHEDVVSIAAVAGLDVPVKLLVCLGFGVDTYHGVCHAHVLEAVADLIERDAYLGAFSLTRDMPEVKLFQQAIDFVFAGMPENPSIVCSSILAAIDGKFGDHHATSRTRGGKLFINALMSLYWCFQLQPLAERILYLDQMRKTTSWREVVEVLREVDCAYPNKRPWVNLPM